MIWCSAITCSRLSILSLYKELFPKHTFLRAAKLVQLLVATILGVELIVLSTNCRPIAKSWDRSIKGSCGSSLKTAVAAAGANLILDIIAVLLPLPVVWRVQMSFRKKIGVSSSFGLSLWYVYSSRVIRDQADLLVIS